MTRHKVPNQHCSPFKSLASAIIYYAVIDYKRGPYKIRQDCREFFQSEYFELLADAALLNPIAVREALKIREPELGSI